MLAPVDFGKKDFQKYHASGHLLDTPILHALKVTCQIKL